MSFRNRFNSFVNYVYLIYLEVLFDSYQYRIPLNVPLVCMCLLVRFFYGILAPSIVSIDLNLEGSVIFRQGMRQMNPFCVVPAVGLNI